MGLETKNSIDEALSKEARKCLKLTRALQKEMVYFSPMLAPKLLRPISIVDEVLVADIGADAGFVFDFDTNRMTLSSRSLGGMVGVAKEVDGALPFHIRLGSEHIRNISTALFLYHEVTHIGQGIAEYDNVQRLKSTFGRDELAGMDTVSDVVAASGYAAQQSSLVSGDMISYAEHFLSALIYQVDVCFPAFGFGPDKPHKVNRGLGILMSVVAAQTAISDPKKLVIPFDAPFVVRVSKNYEQLAVKTVGLGHEEFNFLHGFDPKVLAEICNSLECGDTLHLISLVRKLRVA